MRAPERPNPSPLSSATVAIGAARHLLRRYRVGPVLVILAASILVIGAMRNAETTTANALSRWQATVEVWTTTGPVSAGETIESGAVRSILVPADLVPDGAVATSPRFAHSHRTRHRRDHRRSLAHRHRVDARRTHPGRVANDQHRTTRRPLRRR